MSTTHQGGSSRDTSILVSVLETGEVYIIASLSSRNDTQVIYVDPTTGSLCYNGEIGKDLFGSEEQALNYITDGSKLLCKSTTSAKALIGYSALGSLGLLLVATRLNATIPNLPGGGCVYTVTETQWIKITLQNPQLQGKGEIKNAQQLAELDIDGKYFFCETRDITRPFPSRLSSQDPDKEFVWNDWFSKPFKDIGLSRHCVILLQGFAECRNFGGTGQQEGVVALIARRSRLHPGTRYLARGLNACSSTGNEVECEQLVWLSQQAGQSLPFSSYIWRRGTIPIWWGAELKLATEAEIYVSSQDPYKGSSLYYQRLSRRYDAQSYELSAVRQKKTPAVPIICVNLLRNGEGKPESILVEHFSKSLSYIKSTAKLPSTWIQVINYDWHSKVKSNGEQETIEGLWKYLKEPTVAIGFCEGNFSPSKHLNDCNGLVVSNENFEAGFCLRTLQHGVIRFNCADSLDRTNAASFFGALQVFVEQCRRLGISLDRGSVFRVSSTSKYAESGHFGGKGGTLPPGWEERFDSVTGKHFYIDHNTRRTTWEHPCQSKPWKRFDMSFDQFKSTTMLSPVNQLADLFLLAGDIHATLYTGSKAMHSHILNIFNDDGGKFSKFSTAQNVKITLQRRYQNYSVDSSRQKQLEMFLGLRLFKHLPSIPIHPLKVLSRHSGFMLKSVPSAVSVSDGGSGLLSFRKKDIVWVCPPVADVVELFIYLAEPCHVCQLLLTVSHGAQDSSYPANIDVRTGRTLDGLKLVLEGACIPQCPSGTNLLIPLMGKVDSDDLAVTGKGTQLHTQGSSYLPLLYDYEELEGELEFLTRVIALTFYPSMPGRSPITLGEIEVLGVALPWTGIFSGNTIGAKHVKLLQEKSKQGCTLLNVSDSNDSTNPFLCDNNYDVKSPARNGSGKLVSQPSSMDNFLDLLTGDYVSTTEQNISSETGHTSFSNRRMSLFDAPLSDNAFYASSDGVFQSSSGESTKELGCMEHYVQLYQSLSRSTKGRNIDFIQAMKLEVERVYLNLSAAERDRALLSIGIDPATVDPNRLLDEFDILRVCKDSDTLAWLGQAALEDKIIASIGLEAEDDIIDFWNINRIGETCYVAGCEICAERPHTGASRSPSGGKIFKCSECRRKTCKFCCAGKGANLLLNFSAKELKNNNSLSSQSGSNNGGRSEGSFSGHSTVIDGPICKRCTGKDILQALYVDYMRVLCSLRRRRRADDAVCKALNEVGVELATSWQRIEAGKTKLRVILNGAESLAEYPYASFLHEIKTGKDSQPLFSLLGPLGLGEPQSYWRAPPSQSSVDFSVVLGGPSDVYGVAIIVSSCGYSDYDCPIIQIWASNKIHRDERLFVGKWDLKSVLSSSPELHGPEKIPGREDEIPRHVKVQFREPVRCRIIWLTLSLPQLVSGLTGLEEEYNLLSFDENLRLKPKSFSSFGNTSTSSRCIHAKRLVVFGKPVKNETEQDASFEAPEMIKMKRLQERAPQLGRFRIPIETERLTDNDLILEQFLSPMVPGLAGFRLDAFNVMRPLITHSPPVNGDMWESSLTWLEDRHILPAVLYIQVSVRQESSNYVTVGEYRLPEVRSGTYLYFDFPQTIEAQVIVFRLLGDVASFVDDITEKDNSSVRTLPLASGLSLANRIKLYYYADPYELGKMASLSAV